MALEEDIPEQPDDKTIPKYKQIDKVTNPCPLPFFQIILLPAPANPPYPTDSVQVPT